MSTTTETQTLREIADAIDAGDRDITKIALWEDGAGGLRLLLIGESGEPLLGVHMGQGGHSAVDYLTDVRLLGDSWTLSDVEDEDLLTPEQTTSPANEVAVYPAFDRDDAILTGRPGLSACEYLGITPEDAETIRPHTTYLADVGHRSTEAGR